MSAPSPVDHAATASLRLLAPAPADWLQPAGTDHDVLVVGGGQSGVATAFALHRAGLRRVAVVDAAPDERSAGVWLTTARMRRLRTPKTRPGPELGIPALGFRAWYEGLHGRDAWETFDRASRTDWAAYLAWFRTQVGVDVRYGTRVLDVRPGDGHLEVLLSADGRERVETTRKLVLATGVSGTGGPYVPDVVRALPRHLWAHTADPLDPASLRGRSVGMLGAAASAFDVAAVALEAGAAEVHLFSRRPHLVVQGTGGPTPSHGAQELFHLLPDDERWRARVAAVRAGSSVPWDSVERVLAHDTFALHLEAG